MNVRRIELAPVLLLFLAGAAIDLSWKVAQPRATSAPPLCGMASTDESENQELEWPAMRLPPLNLVTLDLGENQSDSSSYATSYGSFLSLTPPQLSAAPPFDWLASSSILDSIAVTPAASQNLVVLIPTKPRHSAATALLKEQRKTWQLFGFDSFDLSESAGRWIGGGQWKESGGNNRALGEGIAQVGPLLMAPAQKELVSWRKGSERFKTQGLSIAQYLADGMEGGLFPTPHQLGEQLGRLAQQPAAGGWAWTVAYRVRGIVGSQPTDEKAVDRSLVALTQASDAAKKMAEQVKDVRLATELRRARYALDRRTAAWSALSLADNVELGTEGINRLQGARWAMSSNGWALGPGVMLYAPNKRAPELSKVASQLEQYETKPSGDLAHEIVQRTVRLAYRGDVAGQQMATAVEQHYRNANLRVAITAELMERLLPPSKPKVTMIRDRIAGTPVRGRSTTRTQVSIRTIPDAAAWRLGIEAEGNVTSDTLSHGGPAVLRSHGTTRFSAKKLIVVSTGGLHSAPAIARASIGRSRLVGLSTSFDGVPLVGSYVRSEARNKYAKAKRRAGSEVKVKVERKVRQTLDAEVQPALVRIESRYREEVLRRAKRLGLNVDPIEMRTTETRIIGRFRLVGNTQLSAHTPRMRAPSDSLLSVQMHESALNNAIEGLTLAGERMTAAQLRERLAEKLDFAPKEEVDADADRAIIRFAVADPVRIIFADGHAEMILAIDEMIVRGVRHRNFKVHTFYRPEVNGLVAELVQEGTPQIEGRMRTASRLRLHAVLGKVLGEQRRITLVRIPEGATPAVTEGMKGLVTTQCVIEDGWLGIAVAPERPTDRVALQVGRYVR